MINCQPIQSPCHPKAGNVKFECFCFQKLDSRLPINTIPQSLLKAVEVTCLNRLYSGIGFRNNNGGLEFYSEEFKASRCSTLGKRLEKIRKERQSLKEEYKKLQYEIQRDKDSLCCWNKEYDELVVQQHDVAESFQRFAKQCKRGKLSDAEKLRIRQQLKCEDSRISDRLKILKKAISTYHDNKSRFLLLSAILPELHEKIKDKERELSIANTFTIHQTGLVILPWIKGLVAKSVNLFYDMFDYLAYSFLSNSDDAEALPTQCDNIVLNDPRNFIDMLLSCVSYDRIYVYFPHTMLGKILDKTVYDFTHKGCVKSMSGYYKDYPTLYEYAKSFDDFVPITSKI